MNYLTCFRWCFHAFRAEVHFARPEFIGRGFQLQMRPDGFPLGGGFKCMAGARFSDYVIVAPYGGHITIGEGFYCGPHTVLYGHGGLAIGDNVMVASHVVIVPGNHNFVEASKPISEQGETRRGISIGNDVWIGCGARILDGVRIGDGAVIGAGAVINRDVSDLAVHAGVPGRFLKKRGKGQIAR